MRFQWDDEKADENLRKHGVRFEEACTVFEDPHAVEIIDDEHSTEEPRFAIIGFAKARLLYVVFGPSARLHLIRTV